MIKNILVILIVLLTASIVSAQSVKTFGEGADMYAVFAQCSITVSLLNEYSVTPVTMIDEGYGMTCDKKNKETFDCTFKSYEDASATKVTLYVFDKKEDSVYLSNKAKTYLVAINKETLILGLVITLLDKDTIVTKNCSGTIMTAGGK